MPMLLPIIILLLMIIFIPFSFFSWICLTYTGIFMCQKIQGKGVCFQKSSWITFECIRRFQEWLETLSFLVSAAKLFLWNYKKLGMKYTPMFRFPSVVHGDSWRATQLTGSLQPGTLCSEAGYLSMISKSKSTGVVQEMTCTHFQGKLPIFTYWFYVIGSYIWICACGMTWKHVQVTQEMYMDCFVILVLISLGCCKRMSFPR